MNRNRKHMKILGFMRVWIKKVKKKFLCREAAKVYKLNGTAQRGTATILQLQCLHCENHNSTAGWTDRGHMKTHPNASIYNPHDRNDSCVLPQMDMKWNKPRMGSDTIKACSLVCFWIHWSWSLLAQNLIYSKYKRLMQKSIIFPQVQPCNHNPVNLTEYKKSKEMKAKQKAQSQVVWQELSVL